MISMFSRKSAKGFTLIELLVVIAIIGILSSVVLASLNTARLKSRDTRRIADVKQLQLALALYFDSNASYPLTLSQLAPTYIAAIPTDPVGNVAYKYTALGNTTACNSYHLGAVLEEATNQALKGDVDQLVAADTAAGLCTWNGTTTGTAGTAFSGTSPATATCGAVDGVAQGTANPTEICYDQKP